MSQPAPLDAEELGVNDLIFKVDSRLRSAVASMSTLVPYFQAKRPIPVSVYQRAMEGVVENATCTASHAQAILDAIAENKA